MFNATPGRLPDGGTPVVAGVTLPPGVQIGARDTTGPVAWVTTDVIPADHLEELVRTLAAAFAETGLWPVQVHGLEPSLDRPWLEEELQGPDDREVNALSIFDGTWFGQVYHVDGLESRFHGMAAAVPGPDLTAADLEATDDAGLMLVPTDRPANVPKVIGWLGAMNHDIVGEPMATVLRSWEERFGAVLVAMGFDTIGLQVARPPQADDQFDRLITEHHAFSTDNIDQGLDWDDYLAALKESNFWSFWWD